MVSNPYGPSMLCVFRDGDLTMAKLRRMIQVMIDEKRMLPAEFRGWTSDEAFISRQLGSLLERNGLPLISLKWTVLKDGDAIHFGNTTDLYMETLNERKYGGGAYTVLRFYTFDAALPKMDEMKKNYILDLFKRVVNVLQPVYAAIGHDEDGMKARKGKDILKLGWGSMAFGPERPRPSR